MEKQELAQEYTENMSDNQKLVEAAKDNYSKRIEEIDQFYKRFLNACGDLNTEVFYGSLNTAQRIIELQGRNLSDYPKWYNAGLMLNMIKLNTEIWLQAVHNLDSFYVEGMKNAKNNVRAMNKNSELLIQALDRSYDLYPKFPTFKKEDEN